MSKLFDDRERAAETAFAHDEELRFLAHRRAVQGLAEWAGACMGLDAEATQAYATSLVDDLIASQLSDDRIVARVQTDLERAGKPTMTTQVGMVFSRTMAEAFGTLQGRPAGARPSASDPLDSFERRHRAETNWGSLRF